jgi:1,4-alpha-glucan branching enzyme
MANFSGNFLAGYRVNRFPVYRIWHERTHNYDMQSDENNIMTDGSEYPAKVLIWQ